MYFIPIKDMMEVILFNLNMSGEQMSGKIKKMDRGINLILKML